MNSPPTALREDRLVDHPRPAEPRNRRLITVSAAGVLGGLTLFGDLSLHALAPLGRTYYIVATMMALCLLGVPAAYWLRGAIRTGWRRVLGVIGTGSVILGAAAWITAFLILYNNPAAAFTQRLTPAGSVLMALGMILFGIAVLASGRLSRLPALAPLAVGLFFPAQLTIQLAFFLNGKDGDPGPNGALLGVWGLLWACAGWASRNGYGFVDGGAQPSSAPAPRVVVPARK